MMFGKCRMGLLPAMVERRTGINSIKLFFY